MEETTTTGQQPSSTGGFESTSHRHSGRRRGSRRRRRSRSKLLAVIAGSVIGLLALVMLSVYLFGALARYGSENSAQRSALEKGESELRDARAEVKKIRAEMAALVKQRLPHIKALEFDKVLPVNQAYVRNVLFTETHSGDKVSYEYTIILENIDSPPAVPTVRVLLFDRSGVQIGGAAVDGVGMLRPGDRETFSGDVDVFIDAKPEYFHVDSKTR